MGKKNSNNGSQLGRAIIKDRFGKNRGKSRRGDPTMVRQKYPVTLIKIPHFIFYFVFIQLHTTELEDGYDWGRLNLQSVTEQSQLDEFLATAELAGTEFAVSIN